MSNKKYSVESADYNVEEDYIELPKGAIILRSYSTGGGKTKNGKFVQILHIEYLKEITDA